MGLFLRWCNFLYVSLRSRRGSRGVCVCVCVCCHLCWFSLPFPCLLTLTTWWVSSSSPGEMGIQSLQKDAPGSRPDVASTRHCICPYLLSWEYNNNNYDVAQMRMTKDTYVLCNLCRVSQCLHCNVLSWFFLKGVPVNSHLEFVTADTYTSSKKALERGGVQNRSLFWSWGTWKFIF